MDIAIRAMDSSGSIRAIAAVTTEMVRKAAEIHKCSATAAAALGRSLTAASILGMTLKDDSNTLTLQIRGGGQVGKIVAVANARGEVKGYADFPQADLPLNSAGKLDVGGLVGKEGYLMVIKDLGLKEPYIGQVNLISGEIAEDLAAYFTYSEQIPSAVALGVLVDVDLSVLAAGGYLIQLMPDAEPEIVDRLERRLKEVKPISTLINESYSPEQVLEYVLQDQGLKILEKRSLKLVCDCSRERLESVLISLGKEEIKSMLEQEGRAEVTCHFCNKKYVFDADDLKKILEA